jgi:hypothetical protein
LLKERPHLPQIAWEEAFVALKTAEFICGGNEREEPEAKT